MKHFTIFCAQSIKISIKNVLLTAPEGFNQLQMSLFETVIKSLFCGAVVEVLSLFYM